MVNELLYALEDARLDDAVRVIVFTGEGKTFSAGGDLSYMTSSGESVRPPPVCRGFRGIPRRCCVRRRFW